MRLLRRLFIALVVLAVLLGVGDRVTAWSLDRGITSSLSALPGVPTDQKDAASSSIADVPILTSLIDGHLKSVHVTLAGADLAAQQTTLHLSDVDADLEDVTTSEPHVAARLDGTATITGQALSDFGTTAGFAGTLGIEGGAITAATNVFGQSLTLGLSPSISEGGRGLDLAVTSASIAGVSVSTDTLASMGVTIPTISVPLDDLPAGLALTSATVSDGGLDLGFAGTDIDVSALRTSS